MKIAVFDYRVILTNPIGSCHRRMLEGLCEEHEFTVYAVKFDNPCPRRIRFVRVPVPKRLLALLFVAYHLVVPLLYLWDRLHEVRYDLIQFVESNLAFGDISYTQFCHRAYLKHHWPEVGAKGLRRALRWLDHWLHARVEPWVYRRVRWIVVPSQGLKRELEAEYPFVTGKIWVIPNPVDLERMQPPPGFDQAGLRQALGFSEGDLVLVFVALGHFERKGLPLLLEALRQVPEPRLLVVGGQLDLVREWEGRVKSMGLAGHVRFVGMQKDVRSFLWAADVFAFPSHYETFSLVSFEAAAAGLPLLVPPLYGVEEFMRDGETGFVVERGVNGVAEGLRRFVALETEERKVMGERARKAVRGYGVEPFVDRWKDFYAHLG